jgi:uncharacterized protein DUF4244
MSHPALALVPDDDEAALVATDQGRSVRLRDQVGATTAEYATVTGCGVGFAAVLFKFLTSTAGQDLLKLIFNAIKGLLPF